MVTIVIDVDNVLRDINTPMCNIYNALYNTNLQKKDVKMFNLKETFTELTDDLELYRAFPREILVEAPTEEETTVRDMIRLKNEHKIVIATHQLKGFENYTLMWLENKRIKSDAICFVRDKYLVKGDVFIDDKFLNLELYKLHNPNSLVIAYNQPWNVDWKGERIESLDSVNKVLKKYF